MEFLQTERDKLGKQENLGLLVDRVVARGGVINDVQFLENDIEGIGIFSKGSIAAGSIIASIPFRECISIELVQDSNLNSILVEHPILLTLQDEVIAIALMYALDNENCPWSLHVNTMPRSFNTTLYWSEQELLEIKNCTVFHLTNKLKNQIMTDWESLHEPIAKQFPDLLPNASFDRYLWAMSIIYSRAVSIRRHGQQARCIPPLLDMANHNPEVGIDADDTLAYDETNDRILFLNSTAKEQGEECYAIYGVYPNAKLAFSYGFVIPQNPHRAIDLWTKLSPYSYMAARKQDLLDSHELTATQSYDFRGTVRDQWISPALITTVRVIQANESEMQRIEDAFVGKMLSVRNERASYDSLRMLMVAKMKVTEAEVYLLFISIAYFIAISSN